ncbi:MAG TPA: hypothetical protein VK524_04720 [Polyangiaceae bacterium]|nr:hypothetical protein [Polyangiaceae bacterium]
MAGMAHAGTRARRLPRRNGASLRSIFLGLLGLTAFSLQACRFARDEPSWVEAHGNVSVRQIAASARGVDAVGNDKRIYRYPGPYGTPWHEISTTESVAAAASPEATYIIDTSAFVWRLGPGAPQRWDFSQNWAATAIAVDESDRVYVISQSRAARVVGAHLQVLACSEPVIALAACGAHAFVVSAKGQLFRAEDSACRELRVPGAVHSVAAYGQRLAIASGGIAYLQGKDGFDALPTPILYRETGRKLTDVLEVSVSKNTLWARVSEGHVVMFSEVL